MKIRGHAIELRVCAEDPMNNFLPDIGKLERYERPQGAGVRVDDGMEEGQEIPIYYDPMIAKLIAYGKDRTEAIERLTRAIDEYKISGVATTLSFGKWVINHPDFVSGKFDTSFITKNFTADIDLDEMNKDEKIIAALFATSYGNKKTAPEKSALQQRSSNNFSNWKKNRSE